VTTHYNDLLSQAAGIRELEAVLKTVKTGLRTLSTSMERLSFKVKTPFEQIQAYTIQLERLQETSEMLRRVLRFLYLSKRLEMQMPGGDLELTKAALTLSEVGKIPLLQVHMYGMAWVFHQATNFSPVLMQTPSKDSLLLESDLEGIHVVDNEIKNLESVRAMIVESADRMLQEGMDSQNQPQVGSALQVFYSLKSLDLKIIAMTSLLSNKLHLQIKQAIDIQSIQKEAKGMPILFCPACSMDCEVDKVVNVRTSYFYPESGMGGSTGFVGGGVRRNNGEPSVGAAALWTTILWKRMEKLMDEVYSGCVKVCTDATYWILTRHQGTDMR
jgi:hypothetical protein